MIVQNDWAKKNRKNPMFRIVLMYNMKLHSPSGPGKRKFKTVEILGKTSAKK